MAYTIDLDYLIIFVQQCPSIWDETEDVYKKRRENKIAWEQICYNLKSDYNQMQDKDNFRKSVANEWRSLKGRWNRAHENLQTPSSSTSISKPFKYYDQMSFLEKNYINKGTQKKKAQDSQNKEISTKRKRTSNNSAGAKRANNNNNNNNNNNDRLLSHTEELLPLLDEIEEQVIDFQDDIVGLLRQTKRKIERQIDAYNSSSKNPGPSNQAKPRTARNESDTVSEYSD